MKNKIIAIVVFICCLLANVGLAAREIIMDNDAGIDDVIALFYLLKREDILVKAITIAADGNADCKPALKNIHGILQLTQKTPIPVACGSAKPLRGNHRFPRMVLEESNTLAGAARFLPQSNVKQSLHAVNLLLKTLREAPHPITVLATGPLTNLAELILKHPEIKSKIREIYLMGGAVHVAGNINEVDPSLQNALAEWNIYIDPFAADVIFRSGIPITLVPLDVTNKIPINMAFYRQVTSSEKFIYELFHLNEKTIRDHRWYFWDPLAAVIAADKSIAKIQSEKLSVVVQSGATIVDKKNGTTIQVCTDIDKTKFKRALLDVLNK